MTRLIVILLVIAGVASAVLATTGVMRFQNTKDESIITIDKNELKKQAKKAVEKTGEVGGKILNKTGETIRKAAEGLRGSPGDANAATETPAAGGASTRQHDDGETQPENREQESNR